MKNFLQILQLTLISLIFLSCNTDASTETVEEVKQMEMPAPSPTAKFVRNFS